MRTLSLAFLGLVALSSAAVAQAPTFKVCTGSDAGNYYRSAHILKSKSTSVTVEPVVSQGSLDNLDKVVSGQCDGAFVQSDALLVYSSRNARAISGLERAGVLYQEDANLLCNRNANVNRIVDLTSKHTVAVGPDGSGARTTWDAFILADKKRYQPVQVDTRAGLRALSAVADGSQVQCLLWVGAPKSSFIRDDAQRHGDRIVMAGTDDGDMGKVAKDARGQPVYTYGEIPAGTYPQLQPKGTVYGTKAVGTIRTDALFVVNTSWINANERAYDNLLRSFASAKPQIQKMVNPD